MVPGNRQPCVDISSFNFVSKWENGISVPDSSMLIALAEELDTSVSILLGENIQEYGADDIKVISEKRAESLLR